MSWRMEQLGDEHPEFAESLLVLADTFRRTGDTNKARASLEGAKRVFKMVFGDQVEGHLWFAKCQLCESDILLTEFETPKEDDVSKVDSTNKLGNEKDDEPKEEMDKDAGEDENGNDENASDTADITQENEDTNDSAANEVRGEIEVKKQLPKFENEAFLAMTESYKIAVQQLQNSFLPVANLLYNSESTVITVADSSGDPQVVVTLSAHPLLQYARANLGVISLHEHKRKQIFLDSLPPDVQQEVKAEEMMRKRKNREFSGSPGGLEELQGAIKDMQNLPLDIAHWWLKRFRQIEHDFTFVLDPMEVALNDYLTAEKMRRDGEYFAADEKYDTAFMTQVNHMGPSASAASVIVADTLLGKV